MECFRDQLDWKASSLKKMIRIDYNVEMALLTCHRTKRMVLELLSGRHDKQYKHAKEYANAILKWSLSSSAYEQRDGKFFQMMYVSLDACKRGFFE